MHVLAHDLFAVPVIYDAVTGLIAVILTEALVVSVLLSLAAGDGQAPLVTAGILQTALR